MIIRLYINDFLVDLVEGQKVNYTKQVNSVENPSSRQSNVSRNLLASKSARNILNFEGLGISGSTSNLPYQHNSARLFVGNLCLIFKGSAYFEESTDDGYRISVYDGNIDFFKAMDNLKFDQIPLPEITHIKNVATIIAAWNNSLTNVFNYFLADYNGKTFYDVATSTHINIDYMVPSVQCKYLWNKIFAYLGFTFDLSIYDDVQFDNNFITYPKGILAGTVGANQLSFTFDNQKMISDWPYVNWLWAGNFITSFVLTAGTVIENSFASYMKCWRCPETGSYNLNITGTLLPKAKKGVDSFFYRVLNLENVSPHNVRDIINTEQNGPGRRRVKLIAGGSGTLDFDVPEPIFLTEGETITFIYDKAKDVDSDNSVLNFVADISKVDQTEINQTEFFKGLSVKDFFRELIWRFGLTPYTVKDENKIEFLTWDERINGAVEDWSDRYQGTLSESFIYGSYAKENRFQFKYDKEEEDFNDGIISIDNDNLDESKVVIQSKTYSRQKDQFKFNVPAPAPLGIFVPKLNLWEKELKTDNAGVPSVEYKPLDSRYIFTHKFQRTVVDTRIGSEQLGEAGITNTLQFANILNSDSFQRYVNDNYKGLIPLFNNSKIIKAAFKMNVFDFDNFDLKPRIFVEQLGGEFLVDKLVKNDLTSDFTIAELIKINR